MKHTVFFLDTETTSADTTRARVVQMAIVAKSLVDESSQDYLCEYTCKPSGVMEIGAIATHHITPKMVENLPTFSETEGYEVLMRRLKMDHILVAHNAPYDVAVLKNEGVSVQRYIDTLKVARHILDDNRIESFSLQYLRYFYNLDDEHIGELTSGFAHSALYDTIVLKWFYEFLYQKIHKLHPAQDPIDIMLRLTNEPVEIQVFKFGKYKGRRISEIGKTNRDYIEWLYNAENMKPVHERNEDLLYTLRKIVYT